MRGLRLKSQRVTYFMQFAQCTQSMAPAEGLTAQCIDFVHPSRVNERSLRDRRYEINAIHI